MPRLDPEPRSPAGIDRKQIRQHIAREMGPLASHPSLGGRPNRRHTEATKRESSAMAAVLGGAPGDDPGGGVQFAASSTWVSTVPSSPRRKFSPKDQNANGGTGSAADCFKDQSRTPTTASQQAHLDMGHGEGKDTLLSPGKSWKQSQEADANIRRQLWNTVASENPMTGGEWGADQVAHAQEVGIPLSLPRRGVDRGRDALTGKGIGSEDHFMHVTHGSAVHDGSGVGQNHPPDWGGVRHADRHAIARQARLRSPERNPLTGEGIDEEDTHTFLVSGSNIHAHFSDTGITSQGKNRNESIQQKVSGSSIRADDGTMVGQCTSPHILQRQDIDMLAWAAPPVRHPGKKDDALYQMVERSTAEARARLSSSRTQQEWIDAQTDKASSVKNGSGGSGSNGAKVPLPGQAGGSRSYREGQDASVGRGQQHLQQHQFGSGHTAGQRRHGATGRISSVDDPNDVMGAQGRSGKGRSAHHDSLHAANIGNLLFQLSSTEHESVEL